MYAAVRNVLMPKQLATPLAPRIDPAHSEPCEPDDVTAQRGTQARQRRREPKLPDDFAEALAKEPRAKAFFEKLWPAHRDALLTRLRNARRRDTRRMRIEFEIAILARR